MSKAARYNKIFRRFTQIVLKRLAMQTPLHFGLHAFGFVPCCFASAIAITVEVAIMYYILNV